MTLPELGWWLFILLFFIGLVCSRALVSIGMIGFSVVSFLFFLKEKETLKNFFRSLFFPVISIVFFITLFSFFNSDNKENWAIMTRIKLPFLFLPFAFYAARKFVSNYFQPLLFAFALSVFIAAIFSVVNYFFHSQDLEQAIRVGKHIPVPFSHIRFSLMLCFSMAIFWYLAEAEESVLGSRKPVFYALVVISILLLHILTARSGLVVLYAILFLKAIRFVFVQKRYAMGIAIAAGIFIAPIAAYFVIPSFHTRIDYMRYEQSVIQRNGVENGSDVMRRLSIIGGWELFKSSPIVGVGAGDLKPEMSQWYIEHYQLADKDIQRLPHNQWVWFLACYGLLGTVLFVCCFFFPFFYQGNFRQPLLQEFFIVIFFSFLVEPTIEEQIGTAFFLVLWLLLLANYFQESIESKVA